MRKSILILTVILMVVGGCRKNGFIEDLSIDQSLAPSEGGVGKRTFGQHNSSSSEYVSVYMESEGVITVGDLAGRAIKVSLDARYKESNIPDPFDRWDLVDGIAILEIENYGPALLTLNQLPVKNTVELRKSVDNTCFLGSFKQGEIDGISGFSYSMDSDWLHEKCKNPDTLPTHISIGGFKLGKTSELRINSSPDQELGSEGVYFEYIGKPSILEIELGSHRLGRF